MIVGTMQSTGLTSNMKTSRMETAKAESEDGSNHGDVLQADENFRPEGYGGYDEDDELEDAPPILSFDSDSEYELDGEPDGED